MGWGKGSHASALGHLAAVVVGVVAAGRRLARQLSRLDRRPHARVEVERVGKRPHRARRVLQPRVDLAEEEVDLELVGRLDDELLQSGQGDLQVGEEAGSSRRCLVSGLRAIEGRGEGGHVADEATDVEPVHRSERLGAPEGDHRALWIDGKGLLVDLQGLVLPASPLEDLQATASRQPSDDGKALPGIGRRPPDGTDLADAADEDGVLRVDLDRPAEAVLGLAVLVLAEVGRAEAVPEETERAHRGRGGQPPRDRSLRRNKEGEEGRAHQALKWRLSIRTAVWKKASARSYSSMLTASCPLSVWA